MQSLTIHTVCLFFFTDCGDPSNLMNGNVSWNETTFKSVAHYICDEGFGLDGPSDRICMRNAQWSFNMPSCVGKSVS